jgi:hypothetical protein
MLSMTTPSPQGPRFPLLFDVMHPLLILGIGLGVASLFGSGRSRRPSQRSDGACTRGPSSPPDRCRAIVTAVRPDEAAPLVSKASWFPPHESRTQLAACVLRGAGLVYVADKKTDDRWCSPSVTLQRGGGDCDDFAIVAASLLLALGVNAWVAIGRTAEGAHAWVVGMDPARGQFVLEPQTGQIWWGAVAPGYIPELVLGPLGCFAISGSAGWQELRL